MNDLRILDYVSSYMTYNNFTRIYTFICVNFGIYAAWILMHYFASHLYVYWCVPATVLGLIMSPFLVPAPHCYGLRWIIYQGGNSIIVMWSIIGIWILSYIVPIKQT